MNSAKRCWYCGVELIPYAKKPLPNKMLVWPPFETIDHLTPVALGGSNLPTNKVSACLGCNASKGRRTVEQYRLSLYYRTPPGQVVRMLHKSLESSFIEDKDSIEAIIDSICVAHPLQKFYGETL